MIQKMSEAGKANGLILISVGNPSINIRITSRRCSSQLD